MAEGLLFDVAGSILTKLGSLALREIGLLLGVQGELKRLQGTLETIQAVLLDAEKQYHTSKPVKVWLNALKDIVYDADDLLDDISTKELSQRLMSGNKMTKEVQIFFSSSNRIAFGHKIARKIKEIRARLDDIERNRTFFLNQIIVEPVSMDIDRETHASLPRLVIGREDDKEKIMSLLLDDHLQNVVVIPIVGMGGLGKTTLAQMIYNDEMLENKFELKIWVCVSESFHVKSIVEKIIRCIDGEQPEGNIELEVLKNKLLEKIKGKKYLFVLDDIWNEEGDKWASLSDLITCGARGSRIMVTTRSKVVADITCTSQIHELKHLSELESWDLFQKIAFKQGQERDEKFEKLGKEIAAKCGGLPLAIRTIGSLLCTKREESEWQYFKDEEFSTLDPNSNILEILKLSYNHLLPELKQCFAYCSLFPKDSILDVSRLINYWKAQGYVEGNGYNCLKYLVQRSFFQVEEENEDGEIVRCRMHDFMHDLATLVAGEEIKLLVYGSFNRALLTGRTRHVSLYDVPVKAKWQDLASLLQGKRLRTLILVFQYSGELAGEEWATILSELKYLRVLGMHHIDFEKLPSCIGRLKHLRQLELSLNREIERIPNFITRLHNLQVLNFDGCQSLNELPRDIKKLVNLIHLGFEWDNLKEIPRGIGELTSLEVLPLFILPQTRTRFTGGLDELHKLNKLKGKLKILNLQYVDRGALECEAANLKDKMHLQSLTLNWGSLREVEDMSSEEKSLEALQPNVYLRELKLEYYGGVRFPVWVSSLENLISIEIVGCNNCKSLPSLDGLPFLQHLDVGELSNLEYMIDNNVNNVENTKGGGRLCFFPKLKTLDLKSCPKLKGWWRSTEEPLHYQLPSLYELVIQSCPNFKGWMPLLPSLSNLHLDGTGSELLEEILKQAKSPSTSTSTRISPLRDLSIGVIGGWDFLGEEALRDLASLKTLVINNVADASVLVQWLHHLSSLERLSIRDDKAMELFEENNTELIQHCLQNLRTLSIRFCSKIQSLPNGIQHLTSLEKLVIEFCMEMKALPAWICNLASLNTIYIWKCHRLSKRCRSNRGEDWSFISHIPNISVDYEWVQRNGRYQLSDGEASSPSVSIQSIR